MDFKSIYNLPYKLSSNQNILEMVEMLPEGGPDDIIVADEDIEAITQNCECYAVGIGGTGKVEEWETIVSEALDKSTECVDIENLQGIVAVLNVGTDFEMEYFVNIDTLIKKAIPDGCQYVIALKTQKDFIGKLKVAIVGLW